MANNKNKTKKQKKKNEKIIYFIYPAQPWVSMRGAMIIMAITSLALAILIAWQVIPANGWLEGILWGLLFGGMIWVIFFGNLWVSKKLRK